MIRIGPRLKTFGWGQTDAIPRLLHLDGPAGPVAEAWFGAHESDPSRLPDGTDLAAAIAGDPSGTVGGDTLPYLLKVLAIASPLSLQVHPTAQQARAGFAAEEDAHADAGPRTFTDPRHKPEMIVALTPMRLLVGLRPPGDLAADLQCIGADDLVPLVAGRESLLTYVMAVLGGDASPWMLERLASAPESDSSLGLAGRAARAFPGDPGALVALAMNAVMLQPGQAVYVPPRMIHSYQSGIGVEIMANSDNVVRGGLTPKPVDVPRLEAILDGRPCAPLRPHVRRDGAATTYTVPVDDFALVRIEGGEATVARAPRIVLSLGETTVTTASGTQALRPGEAAFIALADGVATIRADGTSFVALPGGVPVGSPR